MGTKTAEAEKKGEVCAGCGASEMGKPAYVGFPASRALVCGFMSGSGFHAPKGPCKRRAEAKFGWRGQRVSILGGFYQLCASDGKIPPNVDGPREGHGNWDDDTQRMWWRTNGREWTVSEFRPYQSALNEKLAKRLRPLLEYHEDYGSVLWWRWPIEEPPAVGSPLDSDWLLDPGDGTLVTQRTADKLGLSQNLPSFYTHWLPPPDDRELWVDPE